MLVFFFFCLCVFVVVRGNMNTFMLASVFVFVYMFSCYGMVGFNGISNIIGYLKTNPLYTYISNIYDLV